LIKASSIIQAAIVVRSHGEINISNQNIILSKMTKNSLIALNENQKQAVVSEDNRLLVLAGAGSGKTKTLLQKLVYLIEEKGVKPYSILAITFTKNAANEMIDRLIISADQSGLYEKTLANKYRSKDDIDSQRYQYQKKYKWIDGLTLRTFHSFCYQVLKSHGVNEFDNKFKIIGDEKAEAEDEFVALTAPETVFEVFHKILIHKCEQTEFLLELKRHVLDFFVDKIHIPKHDVRFANHDGKFFTALDGTKVRSKSEQFIADWLFRHSIKYQYEVTLEVDYGFKPDFYIPAGNFFIEHISEKSFPMASKREQFKKAGFHLEEIFEFDTKDSALFHHKLDKIMKNRVPGSYYKTITLSYNEEFKGYHEAVRKFVYQVIRVMDMMKVENIDPKQIHAKAKSDQHERIRNFYALAIPLIEAYSAFCVNKSYLDFNDLILRTISLFKTQADIAASYRSRFEYVLVDEFQDVNNLQVELIKLLLTDRTQLFCVGDDWQSIYGFRGSNVSYIIDFAKHFPHASIVKLNLNYRSTQHIVGASSEVIKFNKYKVEKDIFSSRKSENKIVIFAGNTEEENIQYVIHEVKRLQQEGVRSEEILFLYRRNKMFSNVSEKHKSYYHRLREEGLKVQGKTIHAAKGLEAKVVFILGLTDGDGGFPDIWLEDRIFQIIKKANHELLMEEERRLFYVAMTRAKEKLFLITLRGNESSFLKEIPETYTVRTSIPLKALVETIEVCKQCSSELNKLWRVCPYCGEKINS
jgi:DNA helicase IV